MSLYSFTIKSDTKSALLLLIFFLILIPKFNIAQNNKADLLIGDWIDSKKEILVRCYKSNGKYFAKTLWVENLADIGKPLPKEEQHWINMIVMKDFEYDCKNSEWINGTIYQPKTNRTYTAYIKHDKYNTIQVVGYIWFRIFCESIVFTRVIN